MPWRVDIDEVELAFWKRWGIGAQIPRPFLPAAIGARQPRGALDSKASTADEAAGSVTISCICDAAHGTSPHRSSTRSSGTWLDDGARKALPRFLLLAGLRGFGAGLAAAMVSTTSETP